VSHKHCVQPERSLPLISRHSKTARNRMLLRVTINFSALNKKDPDTCKNRFTCSRGHVDLTRTKFPNVVVLPEAISPMSRTLKTPRNANIFCLNIFWVCSKFSISQLCFTIRFALCGVFELRDMGNSREGVEHVPSFQKWLYFQRLK
jgi:hypothetical protein